MSDKTIQSTYFPTGDGVESNQVDPTEEASALCVDGVLSSKICRQAVKHDSGHKNELYGERVMRRSATTTREVKLPLSFRTLDTREVFSTTALLDSGATDSCIDKGMIDRYKLKVENLDRPIPVFNADGGRNKLGDITGYVDLEMTIGDHKETM